MQRYVSTVYILRRARL